MSLKEIANKVRDSEVCKHCTHNPSGKEPFRQRAYVDLTPLTEKLLAKMSQDSGLSKDCVMCFCVRKFLKVSPEVQMQALEELQKAEAEEQAKHN